MLHGEDKDAAATTAFVERRRWPRVVQDPLGNDEMHSPTLTPLRFETESLPSHQQFRAWREHISALFDTRLPDNIDPADGFVVRQAVWDLNGMLVQQQNVPAFSYERRPDMVRFSPIDHWQFTFLRHGRTWTGFDGIVAQNEPGMMEVRSLGRPFSGRALATESIALIIPDDQFFDHSGLPAVSNNLVLGGRRVKLLFDHLRSLEANLANLTQEDLPGVRERLRQMVLKTVIPFVDRDGGNDQISHIALIGRARHYIRRNLTSPDLTPDALSRELAISRTRLYELFEASGGVAKYIRRQRLSAAHAMLANPSEARTVAEVGAAVGFDSAANFSRAFTHQFGHSPRNIRRHPLVIDSNPEETPNRDSRITFESLLKTVSVC